MSACLEHCYSLQPIQNEFVYLSNIHYIAVEKAVSFIETGQLPGNWDVEMLKKKPKKGESEEQVESSNEDSDDEYDEEKDAWLASLHKFMEERGKARNTCVDLKPHHIQIIFIGSSFHNNF